MQDRFAGGGFLQLTLRQLQDIAASRNLWLTFAAVVLLFAFTGPFGTLEQLRFLPRLGYWLTLHGLAWTAALIFSVLGDILLSGIIGQRLWRMMIGAMLAAIPIGAITQFMQFAWSGDRVTAQGLLESIALALPLSTIFCTITYMTMSAGGLPDRQAAGEAPETTPPDIAPAEGGAVPLLRRLKPENRGPLQHISVEDHYTLVRTSRGKELILLRFSDAVGEVGATTGRQVHRSHWVADDFVASVSRANGKVTLTLVDGTEIPVSRTYAATVRARFG